MGYVPTSLTRTPASHAHAAAPTCPSSFCQGLRQSQSSASPVRKIKPTGGSKWPIMARLAATIALALNGNNSKNA